MAKKRSKIKVEQKRRPPLIDRFRAGLKTMEKLRISVSKFKQKLEVLHQLEAQSPPS